MKIIIFLLSLFFISCSTSSNKPTVLGSDNMEWIDYASTEKDILINDLRIKLILLNAEYCVRGKKYVIELDGQINSEATFVIDSLLKELDSKKCINSEGTHIVTNVTLNSTGGYVESGIKLGKIFRKYSVYTRLADGQECASSCAYAFVGGKYRAMSNNTELMFHSPYYTTDFKDIYCTTKQSEKELNDYFVSMLGEKFGNTLFTKTMNYCSLSDGWSVNKDAATIYGLTNE